MASESTAGTLLLGQGRADSMQCCPASAKGLNLTEYVCIDILPELKPDHCADLTKPGWPVPAKAFHTVVDTGGLAKYSRGTVFWEQLARVMLPDGVFYATGRDHFQDRPHGTRDSLFAPLGNHMFQLRPAPSTFELQKN